MTYRELKDEVTRLKNSNETISANLVNTCVKLEEAKKEIDSLTKQLNLVHEKNTKLVKIATDIDTELKATTALLKLKL